MFDVEVTGYDEAIKFTENLGQNMVYSGMNQNCKEILEEADRLCGLKESDFKLYITKEGNDTLQINGHLTDKSKLPCVKLAFEKVLPTIPDGIRQLFEDFLKNMEEEQKE